MDIFKCKYITHENEEIIGFCLNQNCSNATQYCYDCLTTTHSDHQNDCVRFQKMNQYINEFIQVYNRSIKQFKEISKSIQHSFEQIFKIMEQDVKQLEKMTQQLQNKEYLVFKSQINIIKMLFKKEKENQIQKQIIQLNDIFATIQNIVTDLNKSCSNQVSSGDELKNDIKIKEIYDENEDNKKQRIVESESYFNEGLALYNLNKYQEAIECYDKAIAINPKFDVAWNNKGFALKNLNKYQEAIECYDKAIAINPKFDSSWCGKGLALYNLDKYQEAIECYDKAIAINPKYDVAWNNKGLALHKLLQYKDAISCFDQALNLKITPQRLKNKADSLFEFGNKSEAKQFYLAALETGSNEKTYIQSQLLKL